MFEVRGLPTKGALVNPKNPDITAMVGNIFFGDKGAVLCPNYNSGMVIDPEGKVVEKFSGGGDSAHFANFIKAVRSRNRAELNAEVTEGHLSSALCHLGNISYRLGNETPIGEVKKFTDNAATNEAFGRMVEHLKDNKVDLGASICKVGTHLHIDPKSERFTDNNSQAQAMLFREYRKGFEVKDSV